MATSQAVVHGSGEIATEFRLRGVSLVEYDAGADRLYIARLHEIWQVENGRIFPFAGSSERGFAGDRGPASDARFNFVQDMAVGSDGCLYVSDSGNLRVRKITRDGSVVTTVIGNGNRDTRPIPPGTVATATGISSLQGIAFDSRGRLHFGDSTRIYRLELSGTLTLMASLADAAGLTDEDVFVGRMTFDVAGNLVIAEDRFHRIRSLDFASGQAQIIAGGSNVRDGPALQARFHEPQHVVSP